MTPAEMRQMRDQLLEAMGCVSEDRYCRGWMPGLSQALHEEGGLWELVGRITGWPIGDDVTSTWTWVTWDEATRIYNPTRRPAPPKESIR